MTLIYKLDLGILKMYLHAKNKFLGQGFQKLEPETGHADRLCCSCSCDLDLDPMTLTYELGQDILKMYLHTNKSSATAKLARDTDAVDISLDSTINLNPR